MQATPKRHPDHCPHHPEDLVFRTTTETTGTLIVHQHRCAHPGCEQPIGWYTSERTGHREFQHGPGAFEDSGLEQEVDEARREAVSSSRAGSCFVTTFIALVIGLSLQAVDLIIGAVIGYCVAALALAGFISVMAGITIDVAKKDGGVHNPKENRPR